MVCLPKGTTSNSDVQVDGMNVKGLIKGDYIQLDTLSSGTHRFKRTFRF